MSYAAGCCLPNFPVSGYTREDNGHCKSIPQNDPDVGNFHLSVFWQLGQYCIIYSNRIFLVYLLWDAEASFPYYEMLRQVFISIRCWDKFSLLWDAEISFPNY